MLTGSDDNTARLWSSETGREVLRFEGHSNSVASVAFSADGKHVLTGSWDGTARLWEAETGKEVEGSIIYRGSAATRERVDSLPRDVGIVHFATHAVLNQDDPNESYLVLANGGRLTLGDLWGVGGSYPAGTTVLSACATAVGQSNPSKDVANLASGFFMAGSTTILASLWQVSDESTAQLMSQFYRELKAARAKAKQSSGPK